MRFQDRLEKDLFEQVKAADAKIGRKTRFLLPRVKKSISLSYENIIFLAIAFIMTSIIFFSLGVEKGRRDVGYIGSQGNRGTTPYHKGTGHARNPSTPSLDPSTSLRAGKLGTSLGAS